MLFCSFHSTIFFFLFQLLTLTQDALKQYQFRLPQQGDTVAEFVISDFGSIFVKLFPEDAPLAVENFVTHAKEGYYDECTKKN